MRTCGEEGFGDNDGGGTAVGSRAALKFSEGRVDASGLEDLVEGVDVVELGVWILSGVGVVDTGDFGEVIWGGAVSIVGGRWLAKVKDWLGGDLMILLLHILSPRIPKQLRRTRRIC